MILQCTQKAYHGHCFSLLQETKKWKFRFGWRGYSRNLREGPNVKGKGSRGIIYNWNRNRRAHHTWNNDRDIDRCTPVCLTYAHVFIYGQGDRTGMPWGSRVLLTPTPTPPQHNHTIFWLIFFFFFFCKTTRHTPSFANAKTLSKTPLWENSSSSPIVCDTVLTWNVFLVCVLR